MCNVGTAPTEFAARGPPETAKRCARHQERKSRWARFDNAHYVKLKDRHIELRLPYSTSVPREAWHRARRWTHNPYAFEPLSPTDRLQDPHRRWPRMPGPATRRVDVAQAALSWSLEGHGSVTACSSRPIADMSPTTATLPFAHAVASVLGSASRPPRVFGSARSETSAVAGSPACTSARPE